MTIDAQANRSHFSSIVAACIVAAGLICAALIVAHKPPATTTNVSAKPVVMPPITQESARDQIHAQVMASPKLRTWTYKKITYTLQDIQIKPDDVTYSAKDDTFDVSYHLTTQPSLPSELNADGAVDLNNDGYNHYSGYVHLDAPTEQGSQTIVNDTVTIK